MKTSRQRKAKRRKERFKKHFHSEERVEFFRGLPCELTGKLCSIHNAHMKSRGAGGTYGDIVPLHFLAHKDFDEMPNEKFEAKYRRTKDSVKETALFYHNLWKQHGSK
jgi:hypothetical protein